MALPKDLGEIVDAHITDYCLKKIPPELRHQVRLNYKRRGNTVTLLEEREAFGRPGTWVSIPVAQFRYQPQGAVWMLYWPDRSSRWHPYLDAEPATHFLELLAVIENDKSGLFWG